MAAIGSARLDTRQLEDQLTKLYVSDLSANITSEELRAVFEPFGPLDEVVVKHGVGQHGAHFGFVWTDHVTAHKLMSQSHEVGGMLIPAPVLARRQHRCGRDPKLAIDPRCAPDKIFVGGLSNDIKLEDFRAHFAKYGAVKDATIMCDRMTSRSRGFGFVIFEDPAAVTAVLAEKYHELDGRKVEVKPAVPKEMMLADDGAEAAQARPPKGYAYEYPPSGGFDQVPFQSAFDGASGPPMVMAPPYYAYGVQAAPAMPPMMPPMSGPLLPMSPTHGVPMPAGTGDAHNFVMLPPYGYSAPPPPMPMFPMQTPQHMYPMPGVPVGGPVYVPRGAVIYAPPTSQPSLPPEAAEVAAQGPPPSS